MRKRVTLSKPIAVEIDGYESTYSLQDFEDEDVTVIGESESVLERINIDRHYEDYYSDSYLPDVQDLDTEDPFKNTELVIKFSPKIHPRALEWFVERVTAKKSQGGAELLMKREPYMGKPNEGLVIHVTAAGWRLLEVAEKLEIKKMDFTRNAPRPFHVCDLHSFMDDSMEISDILTPAEKQIAVMHELKHLHVHPGPTEKRVPGYRHIKLTPGQSIFHVYITHHLISSYFALHQEEQLALLDGHWFWEFWSQYPYENIRSYFGDQTCLYFNFVAYYSYWLTIPAVIGIIMRVLPDYWFNQVVVYFCIANMLLVTVFLIMWQRYQSRLTYLWGTLKMNDWEEPRDNHEGVLALDPVTGRLQRRYPFYKSVLKTYGISLPIVLVCCGVAIFCMYVYLYYEVLVKAYAFSKAAEAREEPNYLKEYFWILGVGNIPVTLYAITVFVFTKIYRWIANKLTEWENHRTETQFERHLVHKMVVFEAANSFSVLYYTAFVINDPKMLQQRLFVLLAIVQSLMTVEQCVVPIFLRRGQAKMYDFLHRVRSPNASSQQEPQPYPGVDLSIEVLDEHDKRVEMSKLEELMDPYEYEADFDEYLNLYLQFGYIFLFSAVYTPSPAIALLSNLFLLFTSLFKRRMVYQRAMARRVSSIGAWLPAFEFMSYLAVITNCALLATNESLREQFSELTDMEWLGLFVLLEHLTLALQYFVKSVCPKVPYNVKVGMAKMEYDSRQALQREQAKSTRRRLTQLFQPISRKSFINEENN